VESYKSKLNIYETQKAIGLIKRVFEDQLSGALNLRRVSAPLFVESGKGLNDDLNGFERPVSFDIAGTDKIAHVVHSLAKWKRVALHNYGFAAGEGLYTDMNAIRRDEVMDNIHSIYVDQWDWEIVIERDNRNLEFLYGIVRSICGAISNTLTTLKHAFPQITINLKREVTFITSQELEDLYPDLTPKEREHAFAKKHGTIFISQIGKYLKSGGRHDGRSPDYDDWELNGDILYWDELLGISLELSSMGIRVDADSLDKQLTIAGADKRRGLLYHSMLLNNKLPLTIGGGIGQSRLCMLLLEKAHVGEVQSSIWDEETLQKCAEAGIRLL